MGQEHCHTRSAPTPPLFNLYPLLSSEKATNLLPKLEHSFADFHMTRIIVYLKLFYKWLFSLKIVRYIHVLAYRNSTLPHVVLYLRISHSLMYLPGPPLRVILGYFQLGNNTALGILSHASHHFPSSSTPKGYLAPPPLYPGKGTILLSLITSIYLYVYR